MIASILFLIDYSVFLLKNTPFFKLFNSFSSTPTSPYKFELPTIEADAIVLPEYGLKFRPLLYLQRYNIVTKIIEKKILLGGCSKVIDFGCAEIALFKYLKNVEGVAEYIAVDVDDALLERHKCLVQPLTFDHLVRRTTPFNVKVLCGSVSQPDRRLLGANAVVAIELIEHLYPDTLEDLPFNIFGIIQPEIAVFTTPNCEFNVLFTNLIGFRHDDHKFEWSREQFEDWAHNLVLRYPNYEVKIDGIGPGPIGTDHLGCCTQIAIFFRKGNRNLHEDGLCENSYKTISDLDYPFITPEEFIESTVKSRTNDFVHFTVNTCKYLVDDEHRIPLGKLVDYINLNISSTEAQIRSILKNDWTILETFPGLYSLVIREFDHDDRHSQSSDLSNLDGSYNECILNECEDNITAGVVYSDWDTMSDNASEPQYTEAKDDEEINSFKPVIEGFQDCSESSHVPIFNTETFEETDVLTVDFKQMGTEESCVLPLPKCHSLEQINPIRNKNKTFRFSLNMEKNDSFSSDVYCPNSESKDRDKSLPSFSDSFGLKLEDSSQSKAVDSGYPNSYGQDMEMDLTPEQVDEIITETESSFDEDEESVSGDEVEEENRPLRHELPPVIHFLDNVENGDVANNNRDGEGNNMEENRQQEGDPEFLQGIVEDGAIEHPNMEEGRPHHYHEVESEDEAISNNLDGSSQADSSQPMLDEEAIHRCLTDQEIAVVLKGSPIPTSPSLPSTPFNTRNPSVDQIVEIDVHPLTRFPTWLSNILMEGVDENDLGSGDVESLLVSRSTLDDNESNQEETDVEIDSGSSYEVIIPGDVRGGGEPCLPLL